MAQGERDAVVDVGRELLRVREGELEAIQCMLRAGLDPLPHEVDQGEAPLMEQTGEEVLSELDVLSEAPQFLPPAGEHARPHGVPEREEGCDQEKDRIVQVREPVPWHLVTEKSLGIRIHFNLPRSSSSLRNDVGESPLVVPDRVLSFKQ